MPGLLGGSRGSASKDISTNYGFSQLFSIVTFVFIVTPSHDSLSIYTLYRICPKPYIHLEPEGRVDDGKLCHTQGPPSLRNILEGAGDLVSWL